MKPPNTSRSCQQVLKPLRQGTPGWPPCKQQHSLSPVSRKVNRTNPKKLQNSHPRSITILFQPVVSSGDREDKSCFLRLALRRLPGGLLVLSRRPTACLQLLRIIPPTAAAEGQPPDNLGLGSRASLRTFFTLHLVSLLLFVVFLHFIIFKDILIQICREVDESVLANFIGIILENQMLNVIIAIKISTSFLLGDSTLPISRVSSFRLRGWFESLVGR